MAVIGFGFWVTLAEGPNKILPGVFVGTAALIVLSGKVGVAMCDRRAADRRKALRKRVARELLRYMHDDFFDKGGVADEFNHRITLFVCEEGDGGSEKCLKVFARRGGDEKSQTAWAVDDSDPTKCRGIAGLIWYNGTAEFFDAGWDWDDNGGEAQKAGYAKALGMTPGEVATLSVKARYFAGAVVMVGGTRWGVLLIDSVRDWIQKTVPGKRRQQEQIGRYALLVSSLLEQVKP